MSWKLCKTFPEAVQEASAWLNEDPKMDRIMIVPEDQALGSVLPKHEGRTGYVTCSAMGRDEWHVLTRDNFIKEARGDEYRS